LECCLFLFLGAEQGAMQDARFHADSVDSAILPEKVMTLFFPHTAIRRNQIQKISPFLDL
jgi:hypothetical protein